MMMKIKNVLYTIFAVALVWSCSKDDGPSTPVSVLKITSFSPTSGPVGTEVTIGGTNFATTAVGNTVKFGTVKAEVGSASATSLKVTVPANATTSKITVTAGGDTVTSTSSFTVKTNVAPVFGEEAYGFEASEDIADTDAIGTLTATDNDGDNLTYSITTNSDDLFAVSATGALTLAEGKALDYETATEHVLEVSVSDGELDTAVKVTITVLNVIESMSDDPASFVTRWRTEVDGDQIEIGIDIGYDYNYTIDWGDGSDVEELTTADGNPTHNYAVADTYTVAIQGEFPVINMENSSARENLVSLEQWGNISWKSLHAAFYGCENMVYNATDAPDLFKLTDMSSMFYEATSFNGDIGDWDTSNVMDMSSMFHGATSFNGDISGWDTGNVTDMSSLFHGANSFNQDISSWDTSKVIFMEGMFWHADSFDQDLGDWDISEVTKMWDMFNESGISALNFSNTLIEWAKLEVQPNVALHAEGVNICDDGDVSTAIATLENDPNNWDITYGGSESCN